MGLCHVRAYRCDSRFRTDKLNAREPDPTNSLLNVLAGKQRVQGFQAELNGHLTELGCPGQLRVSRRDGGASNFYPAAVGARLANVPRHTFNFWQTYRLPSCSSNRRRRQLRRRRTSSSTVPLDPTTGLVKQAPGYWVFNAMVERPLTEHITLHANIYNLADRYYYDQLHPVPHRSWACALRSDRLRFRF